jgi:quercetin dioxygenase-like cupin family protein
MPPEILPIKRPDWTPLSQPGTEGVTHKALLRTQSLGLAMLKFEPGATIHEHPAPFEIDVICLEGAGFTSVSGEVAAVKAGERLRWPSEQPHRLWTENSELVTLMVEHYRSSK